MCQQIAGLALAGVCTFAVGCSTTVDGKAVAADKSGQPRVPQRFRRGSGRSAADSAANRRPGGWGEHGLDRHGQQHIGRIHIIDDRSCLALGSIGDVVTYSNSGYVGMRGNQFSTPDAVAADVTQLVTSFPAAAHAQGLLQRARQEWRARTGDTVFTHRTATTVTSTPATCATVAPAPHCRCAKKIPGGGVRTR